MDIKKEPVPAATETDPIDDIESSSSQIYYTPVLPKSQAGEPDYSKGAKWEQTPDGRNQIYLWGQPFGEETENPVVAKNRYISAMSASITRRVKHYCRDTGRNELMGCRVNLPCMICRELGRDTKENGCICRE